MVTSSTHPRRLRAGLVAAAVAVLALLMLAPAPSYAASCFRAGCNGKSPATTGCQDNAITLGEITSGHLRIELRYSLDCETSWARVTRANSGGYCNANNSYAQLRTYDGSGHLIVVRYKQTVCPSGVVYTPMQNNSGTNTAKACIALSPTSTPDTYDCTARH